MARSLNKVMLIGNVGADPEIRTTAGGSRVVQFNLATGYKKRDGNEVTHWHRIVAWERQGAGGGDPFSVAERFVKKGEKLYVEGEIEYRSYEDKDGVTKYITEIRPREVILLGSKDGDSSDGSFNRGSGAGNRERATAARQSSSSYDDFQTPPMEEDDDLPF
jgi:single-strand DNA-binding protein